MSYFHLGREHEDNQDRADGYNQPNRHRSNGSDESERVGIVADGFVTVYPKVK
jgi:hypothetical protein